MFPLRFIAKRAARRIGRPAMQYVHRQRVRRRWRKGRFPHDINVHVERNGGDWLASCPDLGIGRYGRQWSEAVRELGNAIADKAREAGG